MVAQYTIVVAALNAAVGVLGPLVAEEHLGGARARAVILAAQALGTIAGAVVTTIQCEIPEEALSRVSSYDWFGSLAFAPLGLLIAGPVSSAVGTGPALAGCAAMIVLATAAALLSPHVRNLRTPQDTGVLDAEPVGG